MASKDYLQIIKDNHLLIRMIPLIKVEKVLLSSFVKDGKLEIPDDVVVEEVDVSNDPSIRNRYLKFKKRIVEFGGKAIHNYIFDDENEKVIKKFAIRTTVPEHAGHWMCRESKSTMSNISWSKKHHNLAPTLEESIDKYLSSVGKDVKSSSKVVMCKIQPPSNKQMPNWQLSTTGYLFYIDEFHDSLSMLSDDNSRWTKSPSKLKNIDLPKTLRPVTQEYVLKRLGEYALANYKDANKIKCLVGADYIKGYSFDNVSNDNRDILCQGVSNGNAYREGTVSMKAADGIPIILFDLQSPSKGWAEIVD